ncbi:O-methyltransferase [Sutcliffiella halmapala]|uniref:O-methyltransferase n=1 Tax=Sutcliffiella halmapala TaxID=79882 RepID=UPI0009952DF4|nr:hypothetical protein [Sutcliffiella halmapala]
MSMHDFENTLRKWLREIKPKKILEYGPGYSTKIMLQECPDAQITSIEHHIKWYEKAKKQFGKKINLVFEKTSGYKSHYACWPLMQNKVPEYDLIFIDGRRRVECLAVGLEVLNTNGVIILHDAERKEYQHGIALYDVVSNEVRTKVLKKKIIKNHS